MQHKSEMSDQGLGLFNRIYFVLRTLTVLTELCILYHCTVDSLPQSLMAGQLKLKVQVTCHSLYIGFSLSHHLLPAVQLNWLGTFFLFFPFFFFLAKSAKTQDSQPKCHF